MLIPVKIKDSIEIENIEIENTNFKFLNLREEHIEEFLRKNIEFIFEDETLLVVGKQVVNKENGRSDLTAVDENGNLVLIEIKRDALDIIQRKEAFEFQAIRYAASYAKIKTPDDLVDKIFASYIEKYRDEFELGELTAYEKASRILNDFLEKNNALKTFNSKQRIILIASSFDKQTLSASAWLIANNVDVSCFELSPIKIEDSYFIDINRILPPPSLEDFYIVDTDSFINRIVIRNYKQWPNSSLETVNGVRIRFVAGFGDSPEDVPETVKWAMILHMRLLYDDYKPDERAKLEDKKNTLDKAGNLVKISMEIKEIIQSSFILSLVNGVQASNQLSIGQKIERAISAKLKGQFFSRDFDGNYRFIADEDEKEIDATIIKAWFTEVPKEPLIVINKEERLNNKGIICLNNLINKL
ncbi:MULTISPECIES: hypothetical protein [Clostridium]|uniref:DUF91 domain-containing protein n=1 Tax=Clostridium botulinum D str. 1873 TaxID=592027 RepID=A0A9P2G7Q4_CLOBO|nr:MULTISPECIES: hypothetical protein [Clostridium]EES91459.1 conserved hypothetical protein [Clostridium botulinum D str. 1873]